MLKFYSKNTIGNITDSIFRNINFYFLTYNNILYYNTYIDYNILFLKIKATITIDEIYHIIMYAERTVCIISDRNRAKVNTVTLYLLYRYILHFYDYYRVSSAQTLDVYLHCAYSIMYSIYYYIYYKL